MTFQLLLFAVYRKPHCTCIHTHTHTRKCSHTHACMHIHTHTHTHTRAHTNKHAHTHTQVEDFEPYFSGRKKLHPRHSDLSFYNWDTNFSTSNSTPNYQVGKGLIKECPSVGKEVIKECPSVGKEVIKECPSVVLARS